jgi:putative hydrolase of the HAD superfamily
MNHSSLLEIFLNKLRSIIFDLDDTLYPEEEFVQSGFRTVAKWANQTLSIPRDEGLQLLLDFYHIGVRGDTFNQWLAHYGYNDLSLVRSAIELYRNHVPELHLFPEVPDLISALRAKYLLGIVSDGALKTQQNKIEVLGLKNIFHAIVLSDEWGREFWKPNTKPFVVALEKLGVNPEDAIYVGDNPLKDFLGGRRLGIKTVWVRRGHGEYAKQEPPTPEYASDYCIRSLTELRDIIQIYT